jgi:hypothetical protein
MARNSPPGCGTVFVFMLTTQRIPGGGEWSNGRSLGFPGVVVAVAEGDLASPRRLVSPSSSSGPAWAFVAYIPVSA